jgi:DNA-binding NarL/FixJ family response regulator
MTDLRIAILDSDSGFVRVLVKRAGDLGWQYRCLEAPPPIDEFVAMRVNALVVDLALLGPGGWEFLERVSSVLPGMGVIVCTGQSSVSQRVRGLRAGADDWVTKPCHPEEVLARVEAVVRRRKRATERTDTGPLVAGELEIRADQFQAFVAGKSIGLTRREFELVQALADARGKLQPFWFRRGHWSEGRRWLEESLAMDSGATQNQSFRAKALYEAGMLARFQGDFARARMLCEQSLASYRALADKMGVLKALEQLSRISAFQEDQTARDAFLAEAASLIETLPDSVVKADAYTDMAIAMIGHRVKQALYPPEAARYLHESERIQRALDNPTGLALALMHLANHALFTGDYGRAASQLDEAERVVMELGDDRLLSRLAMMRVLLDLHERDFTAARRRMEEVIQQALNRGDHQVGSTLPILAFILHGQGLDTWSARVFGLAEALRRTGQWSSEVAVLDQRLRLGDIRAEVRAQLGHEAFAREIEAGHRLTLDDLLAIPHPQAPAPARAAPPSAPSEALTAREIEVLRLLAQGLSNPQIAERLVVSRRTVDAHLRSIYDKLGVKSRDAAIRVARERGIISSL